MTGNSPCKDVFFKIVDSDRPAQFGKKFCSVFSMKKCCQQEFGVFLRLVCKVEGEVEVLWWGCPV